MLVKGSTVKGQNLLASADNNLGYDLWEVYGRFSRAKVNALEWCKEKCHNTNGYGFRIISKNSFSFSVAWEVDDFEYVNPKTGEVTIEPATFIETSQNSYIVLKNR